MGTIVGRLGKQIKLSACVVAALEEFRRLLLDNCERDCADEQYVRMYREADLEDLILWAASRSNSELAYHAKTSGTAKLVTQQAVIEQ